MVDVENWPILIGTPGLLLACGVLIFFFIFYCLYIWLYIACLLDVFRRNETDFPNRNLWLGILLGSLFFGMSGIAALIYYILYKPKLRIKN